MIKDFFNLLRVRMTPTSGTLRPRTHASGFSVCNKKGISLIFTLWILTLLSVLAASYTYRTILSMKMIKHGKDNIRVYYKAREQIELAKAYLLNDNNDYDITEEKWKRNALKMSLEEAIPTKDDIRSGFFIVDEESKLDINTATQEMLDSLVGMKKEISDSILDWRDTDNQPRSQGAEKAYYSRQGYECRNGLFATTYELCLLRGMDEDIFLGEDINRNEELDANEDDGIIYPPDDNIDGRLDKGINNLVTAFSLGKININTAPWEVLAALPGISRPIAKNIVAHRGGGYTDITQVKNAPEVSDKIYNGIIPLVTLSSSTFCIDGVAETLDGKTRKRIRAIFRRSDNDGKVIYWREY